MRVVTASLAVGLRPGAYVPEDGPILLNAVGVVGRDVGALLPAIVVEADRPVGAKGGDQLENGSIRLGNGKNRSERGAYLRWVAEMVSPLAGSVASSPLPSASSRLAPLVPDVRAVGTRDVRELKLGAVFLVGVGEGVPSQLGLGYGGLDDSS